MDILAHMSFCPPGQPFFDVPRRDRGRFRLSDADAPAGWRRAADPEWVNFLPPVPLVGQGWKVHVSATVDNCEQILDVCADHCFATDLGFKFLKSREVLFHRSSKYGDRTASGKFVTIYPGDDAALEGVLLDLGARLEGQAGPAILSDLRWRGGPLYVRYGGFVRRELRTASGDRVLAMQDPDGNLVPDERRPGFRTPSWVVVPAFLDEALEARSRGRLTGFPYRPTQALHFSNGGGVYRGVAADGSAVVLKEARPLAGVDGAGEDAVARLDRERWALEVLAGLPQIPRLIDHRRGHEHFFLVRDEVDGVPLHQEVAARNPLLRAGASDADVRAYTDWATATLDAVADGVAAMHSRGVTWRDLHPGNILVRPDHSLAFIDMEAARPVEDDVPQVIGAPGYMAPPSFRGPAVDRYALGILALDLFVPLAQLVLWGRHSVDAILELVVRDFPVPQDYAARVRALVEPPADAAEPAAEELPVVFVTGKAVPVEQWAPETAGRGSGGGTWDGLAHRLAEAITAVATPERQDRLYPGDPAQFQHPGAAVGFLHGAAGVLWALAHSGAEVPEEHVAWFRRAVDEVAWDRCGFADGLTGVALTHHALGDRARAYEALDRAVLIGRQDLPGRLADGLSGLGLTLLALGEADDDVSLVEQAEQLVPRIAAWTLDPRDRRWGPGLLGGLTGPALFHLRLSEQTGDGAALDRAEAALRTELSGWGWDPDAAALPDALARSPHLAGGGGIALVLHALLRHREAPDLERLRDQLRAACSVPFSQEAGLLYGRAGLMAVLAGAGGDRAVVERHARDLRVHCVLLEEGPVPTGRFGLRASCDLATGSAGLLLGLGALRGALTLPFTSARRGLVPAPVPLTDQRSRTA